MIDKAFYILVQNSHMYHMCLICSMCEDYEQPWLHQMFFWMVYMYNFLTKWNTILVCY